METDEKTVIDIIGEEAFHELIKNGYFPVESLTLMTLLNQEARLRDLNDKLMLLESPGTIVQ